MSSYYPVQHHHHHHHHAPTPYGMPQPHMQQPMHAHHHAHHHSHWQQQQPVVSYPPPHMGYMQPPHQHHQHHQQHMQPQHHPQMRQMAAPQQPQQPPRRSGLRELMINPVTGEPLGMGQQQQQQPSPQPPYQQQQQPLPPPPQQQQQQQQPPQQQQQQQQQQPSPKYPPVAQQASPQPPISEAKSATPTSESERGCGCKRATVAGHTCVDFCTNIGCDGSCNKGKAGMAKPGQKKTVPGRQPIPKTKPLAPLTKKEGSSDSAAAPPQSKATSLSPPPPPTQQQQTTPQQQQQQSYPQQQEPLWRPADSQPVRIEAPNGRPSGGLPQYAFSQFAEVNNEVIQKYSQFTDVVPIRAFLDRYEHEWDLNVRPREPSAMNPIVAAKANMSENNRLKRSVMSILNRLTPENYETLTPEMGTLVLQVLQKCSDDEDALLVEVVSMVYEFAVNNKHYAEVYARMCQDVCHFEQRETRQEQLGKSKFRRALINKCQKEFESLSKEKPPKPNEDELEDYEESEHQKLRRRAVGNIHFVGQLFKLTLLTEKVIHAVLKLLLNIPWQGETENLPDEENLETTAQLLKTVGKQLDNSTKAKAKEGEGPSYMEYYFKSLRKLQSHESYSKRVRYLLQEVIELRARNWEPRNKQEGPVRLSELEAGGGSDYRSRHAYVAPPIIRREQPPMHIAPKPQMQPVPASSPRNTEHASPPPATGSQSPVSWTKKDKDNLPRARPEVTKPNEPPENLDDVLGTAVSLINDFRDAASRSNWIQEVKGIEQRRDVLTRAIIHVVTEVRVSCTYEDLVNMFATLHAEGLATPLVNFVDAAYQSAVEDAPSFCNNFVKLLRIAEQQHLISSSSYTDIFAYLTLADPDRAPKMVAALHETGGHSNLHVAACIALYSFDLTAAQQLLNAVGTKDQGVQIANFLLRGLQLEGIKDELQNKMVTDDSVACGILAVLYLKGDTSGMMCTQNDTIKKLIVFYSSNGYGRIVLECVRFLVLAGRSLPTDGPERSDKAHKVVSSFFKFLCSQGLVDSKPSVPVEMTNEERRCYDALITS